MSTVGGTGAMAGALHQQGLAVQLMAKTLAKVGPAGNMPVRVAPPAVLGKGLHVDKMV